MNNWKTTLGGICAAIGVAGLQVPAVPDNWKWVFAVLAAAGPLLIGASAKDFNTHSTDKEVAKATLVEEVKQVEVEAKK